MTDLCLDSFVRLMILYCGEIEDDDLRKSYTGFVNKMGDRRMRDRILKDATGELRISAVQFDSDPYLINCLNGTYDLRDFSFGLNSVEQGRFSVSSGLTMQDEHTLLVAHTQHRVPQGSLQEISLVGVPLCHLVNELLPAFALHITSDNLCPGVVSVGNHLQAAVHPLALLQRPPDGDRQNTHLRISPTS